jgi:hypothetical protein
MLKLNNTIFLFGAVVLALSPSVVDPVPRVDSTPSVSSKGQSVPEFLSGLTTLRFHDPISHSMKFDLDEGGSAFHDNMVKNAGSDIDFGHYTKGSFTVGIEGGKQGLILDLGSDESIREEFGFSETVGGGQGFASIRLEEGSFLILKDYRAQTTQVLESAHSLFGESQKSSNAPVLLGHIYLVRLTDRHDSSFEKIVKFKVVEYAPEESVTIRWVKLKG